MENVDFDEEEKLRRRKESIEWRNKRRTSFKFSFLLTIFEIVITILIMMVLFLLSALICFRIFDPQIKAVQVAFEFSMLVIFIGSLILGFIVYKAVAKWAIRKFKLEDKLPDDVLMHYRKTTKEEKEEALRK